MSCKNEKLREWIRKQRCYICGTNQDITVSHIKTRGSGGKDENNVIPMCMKCHMKFEPLPAKKKQEMFNKVARYYMELFTHAS